MTTLSSGIKARATLDPVLQDILPHWIGCQRVIYNAKVAEDRLFAAERRLLLRENPDAIVNTPLDQQYAHFKDAELTPWLSEVPSQVLRNGAYRWYGAKQRQLKGLAKAPVLRKKHDFNSVLLTNELFRFVEVVNPQIGDLSHEIEIGTLANPLGRIRFKTKQSYVIPKMIVLRRMGSGKWFVSFCFEHEALEPLRMPPELAYELNRLDDDDLADAVLALDRNTKDNCLADSEGRQYGFSEVERKRLARKTVGRKRHQRRLARQVKGSKNREKTKKKLAKSHEYGANVRENFAHQTSHTLVEYRYRVYALEGLRIKDMVRKPKAKQDASGKWLRNGARAKAGLNKTILGAAWGKTKTYLSYKAARRNKLCVSVPAPYSSQECSQCGHTHPDNRHEQRFVCLRCKFQCHADTNAALVQKKRAIALIRSGVLEQDAKPRKRVAFRRKVKVGADSPELSVEPGVSHEGRVVRAAFRAAGCEAERVQPRG